MRYNCKCNSTETRSYVTLEFSNTTPLPAKIYANEGVAQFIFLKEMKNQRFLMLIEMVYMGQTGVTLPKV